MTERAPTQADAEPQRRQKTEQGQWANTTEQSLAHAKKELAEIERLLDEAKRF